LSLRRLAHEAARAATPSELCAALRTAFHDSLHADQVHLFEVGQHGRGGERTVQTFDGCERVPEPDGEDVLDGRPSGIASVVGTGRPLAVPDARTSTLLRPGLVEHYDVASALFVPVAIGGDVRYVAVLIWHAHREVDASAAALAETLADQASSGFARLDAEHRHAASAAQDRALVRAARALNASLDLQEVLRTLSREAALALHADLAGVYLGDAERGAVATAGHNVPDQWHGLELAPGEGAAGRALSAGRPWATSDYQRDVSPAASPLMQRVRTALAVPMAWNDELKGALSVGWTSLRRITPEDERTLTAIADLATFACHNAETYEQVQHAARTDALTGLLNHGAMQVRVREEIARARRDGTPLTCALVDLDDFKRVNDVSGHQAGDELLRRVAETLQQQLRPYDQVARYGGDEFVLLLPGSDEPAARLVAERVRDAIAVHTATGSEFAVAGACSIGVAEWHEPLGADGLLEHADRALLLAKRTGKGRVAVANPDVERELALVHAQAGSPAAVQALAAAIEERDSYTHDHSEEVVHLARGVAMILGMPTEHVERIAHAALLHDVGKLAVPNTILHKPGPLDDEEWKVMADHPIAGERILLRIPDLAPIAPIVRHEHEHWDGTGYPDRLRGRRIPLGSRVILACDAWHAMRTDRPYRPALERDEAIAELRRGAGHQFDPEVVDALLDLLGQSPPQVPNRAAGIRLAERRSATPPKRGRPRPTA
jgi:diguanylate cyclase (GGDEF)-like protein